MNSAPCRRAALPALPAPRLIAPWALLAAAAPALAHGIVADPGTPVAVWVSQLLCAAAWFAYALGAARRRPTAARRLAFHGAMLLAGLALYGPLDALAAGSSAWHMLQHMLLMVVVAPLLVLARPGPQWRALLGPRSAAPSRLLVRASRHALACAALHALAVWAWHAPPLYMAALGDGTWHVLEHACFLFSAVLFWWAVLHAGRRGAPQAALALLFTLMHTGLLGALLTFARAPLYGRDSGGLWEQQLAGLVMWIPGGAVYLLAAAWATWRWLGPLSHGDAALRPTPRQGAG